MTTLLFIAMVVLLIAALERANRRQSPHAPGLFGSTDHVDRDWARTESDLLALTGSNREPRYPSHRTVMHPRLGYHGHRAA
jgi:hypothetical protein